jgi:hypothetical protein
MTENEKSSVEVFQELYLRHSKGPAAVRDAVLKHLSHHWVHRPKREEEIRTSGDMKVIALERSSTSDNPGVSLWMFEEVDGRYKVSNIVPLRHGNLGTKGYNNALNDFVRAVVQPAADDTRLDYDLSSGLESLDDWTDQDTAAALQRFSSAANKSTGRGHPLDGDRWIAFLLTAHRKNSPLNSEQLSRWLVELERWPSEIANELASEYNLGRLLLLKYDKVR